MVESVLTLTRMGTLLDSDMFCTLIGSYIFLLAILFVSFLNIYSVDKYEFLNNKQKCFEFSYKMFFIIMYSREKHIISKKTFILEMIGYLLVIVSFIIFLVSLGRDVRTAFMLLGINSLLVIAFGCVTGGMYKKNKK